MPKTLKTLIAAVALAAALSPAHAGHRMPVNELIALPHPMRVIARDPSRFALSERQQARLGAEILAVYPRQIHPRVQRAAELERRIHRALFIDGANGATVHAELTALTRLKREITDLRIAALGRFRDILTEAQFARIMAEATPSPGPAR
ncbi:hypothetical protein [Thiococcus pfennigii]|jgi:hypothetical protein|uniref:hypothetical protein n=1 Tax=Thiococcus pfennigii TaxID=1057 RepID=UPI00190334C7|nr:hypothetical protein [Thiococcus pfennigii]MBK1700313.1 hypothetical protein [Thiococcus pfennigii]MBK1730551.1 hypothetical protein [Thiococcus pfennigii]